MVGIEFPRGLLILVVPSLGLPPALIGSGRENSGLANSNHPRQRFTVANRGNFK